MNLNHIREPPAAKAGVPRLWRLALVVVVAAVAFAMALHSFRAPPEAACLSAPTGDPAYRAAFVESPSLGSTDYHVVLTHDGQPITGARVCVALTKTDMSGLANTLIAPGESGGRYEVHMHFHRAGNWTAKIGIVEPGKRPVVVPLSLTVGA